MADGHERKTTRDPSSGGMPGDGVGRREEPGMTGVHPFSSDDAPRDAAVRTSGSWGRSDYDEAGSSELDLGDDAATGNANAATTDIHPGGARADDALSSMRTTADLPGGAMDEGPADQPSGPDDPGGS